MSYVSLNSTGAWTMTFHNDDNILVRYDEDIQEYEYKSQNGIEYDIEPVDELDPYKVKITPYGEEEEDEEEEDEEEEWEGFEDDGIDPFKEEYNAEVDTDDTY